MEVGSKEDLLNRIEGGREASCGCRGKSTGRTNSTTTLMKKLFSLAMVALIAFVIVGCEKKADDTGTGAGVTNAAPQ